jgi:hypothetical protein
LNNQILQFYYQIAESYSQCLKIRHLNLKASRGDYNLESRPSLLCPPSDFDQSFDLLYCSWEFNKGKKRGEVSPAFLKRSEKWSTKRFMKQICKVFPNSQTLEISAILHWVLAIEDLPNCDPKKRGKRRAIKLKIRKRKKT